MDLERKKHYDKVFSLIKDKDKDNIELGLMLAKSRGFCLKNYTDCLKKIMQGTGVSEWEDVDLIYYANNSISEVYLEKGNSSHAELIKRYFPNTEIIFFEKK